MASYEKKCAPPNWNVRSHKRSNGMYDRIYYEPVTGKQFRSRKKAWARFHETKKLLAERVFHVSPGVPFMHVSLAVHSPAVQNIKEAQKREKMASYEKKCGPPNWNVRSHKRSNGMYDRIYYEPVTGKQFRSRKKAWARFHETKKLLAERVFHVSPGVPFMHVSPAVHSPAVQNITEAQKREVEDFLRDAWTNLLNKE